MGTCQGKESPKYVKREPEFDDVRKVPKPLHDEEMEKEREYERKQEESEEAKRMRKKESKKEKKKDRDKERDRDKDRNQNGNGTTSSRRVREEEEDLGPVPVLNPSQLAAVTRIQRLVRNKSAWRIAQQEQEWKIFSDLDTQDEADMLNLAVFMQTLMDWTPNGAAERMDSLKNIDMDVEDEDNRSVTGIDIDSIKISSLETSFKGNLHDFSLPKGSLDSKCAKKIVDVYRKKGRLNIKSIQKILRSVYKSMKLLPTCSKIKLKRGDKLTVVGDLHGQLADLLHILDESGWPSSSNRYVFNGDFVDRGDQGVEVICVLLALYCAMPEYVFLNRGNHEDHAICCVYGFQNECKEKYDELTFGMFVEVFRHLPLFTVVNESIFIVHGGLFHDVHVKISDLNDIDRSDYTAKAPVPYPECTEGLSREGSRSEYLKQLQRDALWSDPSDADVLAKNQRGSGVVFGPEVVRNFLSNNKLNMVVRSHECVRRGFDLPFEGANKHLLCTIFSASNYCGGHNDGAYLTFATHHMSNATDVPGSNLSYTVNSFQTSDAVASLEHTNNMSLHELIIRRKKALVLAFETADVESCGKVSLSVWAEIMQRVTKLKILWLHTIKALAPEAVHGSLVDYVAFVGKFSPNKDDDDSDKDSTVGLDELYGGQRSKLEAVFHFFDNDGNGSISREEFKMGCDFMNTTLPPENQLRDYDHVLNLMDFDQSDSIDINEFFEVFRILDACDGTIDGVISMAGK